MLLFQLFILFVSTSHGSAVVDTLFRSDDVLSVVIRSDFSVIQADRTGEPEYRDAELVYLGTGGDSVKMPVRLMVRGNFRRDPGNCSFPPLYVSFRKNTVRNTLFENQTRLKLVTPCQGDIEVIEEYLIYRMYNLVTEISKKVRLARIKYFDTGTGQLLFERFSFFMEDKDHLAARLNAFEKDVFMTPFDLDRENLKRMAVFQVMIGNKDWYISSRKNIVIIQPFDSTLSPFAVPYDFDFSGFINADYTRPEGVSLKSLPSRRVYKGICYPEKELKEVFDFYRKLKPEFISIIKHQDFLPNNAKRSLVLYINQFFLLIKDKTFVRQEFIDKCETRKLYNLPDEQNDLFN